jgi:hypothetical protein
MSKGIQVTFDAADPHALARWRADLPGYQLAGSHELAGRLRTGGVITDAGTVPGERRLSWPTPSRPAIRTAAVPGCISSASLNRRRPGTGCTWMY